MMTLFVFIFIITGNIFGALLFQDEYTEEVDYTVGGFNTISEAQMRGKMYIPRMEKELNYSSNIVALDVSSESEKWSTTPSKQEIVENYLSRVQNELQSQAGMVGCSPPEINDISVEEETLYTASFSKPVVICRDTGTTAEIKLPEEEISVDNSNNTYVHILRTSVDLSTEARDNLVDFSSWDEGKSTRREACDPDERDGNPRSDAIDSAQSRAVEDSSPAESTVSEFEVPEDLRLETSSEFSYSGGVTTSPDDCTYTEETECPEDSDKDSCETEVETTRTEYTAEYSVSSITYEYLLETKDDQKVLDSEARLRPLDFSFWFRQN